jgi:hypothetical protein
MEDEDAGTMLEGLLDDLLIYEPGDILEKRAVRPSKEDLANIVESETAVRALTVLRRYVRPRNEVLRIRRTVDAALSAGEVGDGNVYSRYLQVKQELEALKTEKKELEERLQTIRGKNVNGNDARNALLGTMILQKTEKQVQLLRIYRKHLKLLLGETEQVDNQTTLV